MTKAERRYYDVPDKDGTLYHTDRDEAVYYILDGLEPVPSTLTLCTYAPRVVDRDNLNPLEFLLDVLDEEYGDWEDVSGTDPTDAMKTAERAFIDAVVDGYTVKDLREVSRETVHVGEWLRGPGRERWLPEDHARMLSEVDAQRVYNDRRSDPLRPTPKPGPTIPTREPGT